MRYGYMPGLDYVSTDSRNFSRDVAPKTDLNIIPTRKEESQGIFCKFSTNLKKTVALVATAVILALPFAKTTQAAEFPNINSDAPAYVGNPTADEKTDEKTHRARPEAVSSETDTFECSLTEVMLRYWHDGYTYTDTMYADIPFALQDSAGNLIDYESYEDTTGSYPSFFGDTIQAVNFEASTPSHYEVLFNYRNRTLIEIEVERDSIDAYHGGGSRMEITVNDSTSQEWLRATMVKWEYDNITGELIFPRCRGPPDYWWVDITPNNPSRTFDDEFLFIDVYFSSDNPEYSGFQYLINLNYIRELVSSVNVPEEKEKNNINGALRPFPNPTNNTFSFILDEKYQNIDIKIYDSTGKLIKKIEGFSNGDKIDLKDIENPSGIYLISVFNPNSNEIIGKTKVTYLK